MDVQSRYYKKIKRSREDYCNICGQHRELTYDHIPPKCCFNSTKIIPLETMSGQAENYNPFCTQNGLKYRSICSQCNNGLLAKYDKALEEFVRKIKDALMSEDYHEKRIFNVRANAIAKSVCGHFLAMKDSYDEQCIVDQRMRDYVQHPNMLPPKGSSLLLRYYPYSTVFLLRDATILRQHRAMT